MVCADNWIEIKGSELKYKVIGNEKPKSLGFDNEPKVIQSGDSILIDIVGRQAIIDKGDDNGIGSSVNDNSSSTNNSDSDIQKFQDGPIFQDVKGWLVTIGEPHCLVRAIEYTLEQGNNITEGQTLLIYSTSKYNWGSSTTGHRTSSTSSSEIKVPASSDVYYQVKIVKYVMDTSRLNPYFTIQRAMTMKQIANDVYQYEWTMGGPSRERAIKLYEKSSKIMHTLLQGTYFANVEENHPQRKECQTIYIDSLNNVVAVYMRAKRWEKALEAAKQVLKQDPHNVKAALRMAKSAIMIPDSDDTNMTPTERDNILKKAETIICYKNPTEEAELKKLRAQWKKKYANSNKQ